MATINTSTISTTALVHFPQYYLRFQIIQDVLAKISFPYLFSIAFIGLITNTSTIILLSKNNITKSLKNKSILIALGMYH
jgi:Co/Zn/Cd efflux system component